MQALNECDPDRRMEFAECFLKNDLWSGVRSLHQESLDLSF
ncbi:hypothetical protein A3Q56_07450 [Intoshia linei]|uniref:Uncharacterized protein n=1 Tax=Intoshia linei TaxID=1819745 RepID=A0A177ASP5_9BILA|nr:hypothetical protein A3Q56_07450 [Intoshia linei]